MTIASRPERRRQRRQRSGREHCGPEPLSEAGTDEQRAAVGQAARERGAREDDEPGDEHEPATEQIGHPRAEQEEAAVGEEITVDDPLQALLAEAEVVLDRRQGDVEDRGIEYVHELDEAEQQQNRDAEARAKRRRIRGRISRQVSQFGRCGLHEVPFVLSGHISLISRVYLDDTRQWRNVTWISRNGSPGSSRSIGRISAL